MAYKNKPGAIALSLKELDDPLDIAKREQLLKELREWEKKDAGNVDSLLDLARKKALINGEDANIDVNDLLGKSELPMPDYPSVDDLKIYELTNKYRPGYGQNDGVASLATDTPFINQPASVPEPSDDEYANVSYPQRDNSVRKFELQRMIDGYDRDIAKLQAEIAMSESGDPMYNLAIMRLIMDNDNSLLTDIRGRIGKKIDQEFQMKSKKADQDFQHNENELNRQNTLEVAKMNKEEQEKAKIKDAEDSYEGAVMLYNWAVEDLEKNKDPAKKTELERNLQKAEDTLKRAARKANKLDEYRELVGTPSAEREQRSKMVELFLRSKGITGGLDGFKNYYDKSLKTPEARQAFLKEAAEFDLDGSDFGMPGEEAIQNAAVKSGKKFTADQASFKAAIEKKVYGTLGLGGKYVLTSKDKQTIADDKAKAKKLGLNMSDPDPATGKATISR